MKIKELYIPVFPLDESISGHDLYIVDHINLTGSSPRNIGFIPVTELYCSKNSSVKQSSKATPIKVAALAHGEHPNSEEKEILLKHGVQAYSYDLIPLALNYCAEGYTLDAKAYIPKTPKNYSLTGFHTGIKAFSKANNFDLGIIYSTEPCLWAGVFTKNAMKAACVETNMQLLNKKVYGIIANSGNANCCNGDLGLDSDHELKALLKNFLRDKYKLLETEASEQALEVLSASTGVIGRTLDLSLPKKQFQIAMDTYLSKAASGPLDDIYNFAKAIMTTDLVPKIAQDKNQHFLGISKGSGMIAPNMATMLAFIISDVKIDGLDEKETQLFMQKTLNEITNETFNNISVDGDTSTNDMVLLLNNLSGESISASEFKSSLREVCEKLSYQIIADGEGLTKIIDLELIDLPLSKTNLQKIGKNIINSMLVKTAIFGSDPNWGRIVAAFAREEDLLVKEKTPEKRLGMEEIEVYLLDQCVFKNATAQLFGEDLDSLSKLMKSSRHINIRVQLADKPKTTEHLYSARFLGNDLSYDYVKINAEYTS